MIIPGIVPDFDVRKLIGMADAAKLLRGRGGKPPHVNTARRWAVEGYLTPSGKRVKLWSIKLNGERLTLPEKCEEFQQRRLAAAVEASEAPRLERPARSKNAARRHAKEYLDKKGIGGKP